MSPGLFMRDFERVRTTRQLAAIALLSGGARSLADIQADFQACIGSILPDDSFRDPVSAMMKAGMVRYASSGRGEVHAMDLATREKTYCLTDDGREALDVFRKLFKE